MKSILSLAPWLTVVLLAGGLPRHNAAAAPLGAKPNILFIAIDDLRPELGCYGNPVVQSPNIDRLAKAGMVFGHAYCQQAVCSPSRTSLLTGTRPDTAKVWDLRTHFRKALPEVVTLPQHFKNHGYFTQAMGKIFHHGLDDPASWSVPTAFPRAPHGAERSPVDPDASSSGAGKRGPPFLAISGPDNALHDGELADMAVAALRQLKGKSQPFFLGVGFIKPHLPFISPKKYWDLYDPAQIPLAPNPFPPEGAPAYAVLPGGELRSYAGVPAGRHLPDDYARPLKHGYLAAVSYVDAQVGRVLEELERLGLRENTIIVLWGDHGWKLGEHDAWAKHSNVENDTRAPLVVSIPGMANAGKTTDRLVEFVDLYPTLSELAGLPLPKHLEGLSFKPLLDEPNRPWKSAAFSQFPRKVGRQNLMGYSMRTERYRLTSWVPRADLSKTVAVELYDHQVDPLENTNVAALPANAALVKDLSAQWRQGWRGALPAVTTATASRRAQSRAAKAAAAAIAQGPKPTLANVPYGPDPLQVLDFWKVESPTPTPLLFFIHGGAWRSNDKNKVYTSGLTNYLAAGISVVSINYRFVTQAEAIGVKPPVKWPLLDAARALQFVRTKAAEWNFDKRRIAASGGSAGACSSLWLAFHDDLADPQSPDPVARESTRLLCVGVIGAQTTLDPRQMKEWTPNSNYGAHAFGFNGDPAKHLLPFEEFFARREQILPWIAEYSPYALVTPDDPPVYLNYSTPPALGRPQSDTAHTANFGLGLQAKLRQTGVPCELVYPGAPGVKHAQAPDYLIEKLK